MQLYLTLPSPVLEYETSLLLIGAHLLHGSIDQGSIKHMNGCDRLLPNWNGSRWRWMCCDLEIIDIIVLLVFLYAIDVNLWTFRVMLWWTKAGMGIPARINSPHGDWDGLKIFPVSFDRDEDGDFSSPRGRGWGINPRWGIPHCHL
jgi:hypothetical protein